VTKGQLEDLAIAKNEHATKKPVELTHAEKEMLYVESPEDIRRGAYGEVYNFFESHDLPYDLIWKIGQFDGLPMYLISTRQVLEEEFKL
jgi:hypothetical protein